MLAPQRQAPEVLLLPIDERTPDVPAHQIVSAQQIRVGGVGELVQRHARSVQGATGAVFDIESNALEPAVDVLHVARGAAHRLAAVVAAQVAVEDRLGGLTRVAEPEEALPPRATVEVPEAHVVANDARS